MSQELDHVPADYPLLLADIKQRIRLARARAIMAVNAELNALYWEVGSLIADRQQREGWGAGVIPRLARDLRNEFPEEKGLSARNIDRMLAFYREYPYLDVVARVDGSARLECRLSCLSPSAVCG